jgi:REP element-mobilizing transposase RayT
MTIMPQSLAKIYLHIVFSTKDRKHLIKSDIESELYKYIAGILKALNCTALLINGTADHIHILNILSRTQAVSHVLEEIKKNSSKWIKGKGNEYKNFYWQAGYGAFSVSQSKIEVVKNYIYNQKEHHKICTFKEEYRRFLKEYNIEYDERYVWD